MMTTKCHLERGEMKWRTVMDATKNSSFAGVVVLVYWLTSRERSEDWSELWHPSFSFWFIHLLVTYCRRYTMNISPVPVATVPTTGNEKCFLMESQRKCWRQCLSPAQVRLAVGGDPVDTDYLMEMWEQNGYLRRGVLLLLVRRRDAVVTVAKDGLWNEWEIAVNDNNGIVSGIPSARSRYLSFQSFVRSFIHSWRRILSAWIVVLGRTMRMGELSVIMVAGSVDNDVDKNTRNYVYEWQYSCSVSPFI